MEVAADSPRQMARDIVRFAEAKARACTYAVENTQLRPSERAMAGVQLREWKLLSEAVACVFVEEPVG